MFSNITPCCRTWFNPNETLYLEFRNNTTFFLYVNIQYKIHGKVVNKQTPVFQPGKFKRLTFPSDAESLYFRVFDASQRPPGIICAKYVDTVSSCYKVTGRTVGEALCLEVPCNN